MSLCLSLLVLIAAHLAPADGKYAHHLWLMHGYKMLWKKARRHNDKDQIGILSYLLPSVWTKCVEWLVKRTESKGFCQVCSHLTAQVIHWELPYSIIIYSIYENALKSFFGGCCEQFCYSFVCKFKPGHQLWPLQISGISELNWNATAWSCPYLVILPTSEGIKFSPLWYSSP